MNYWPFSLIIVIFAIENRITAKIKEILTAKTKEI